MLTYAEHATAFDLLALARSEVTSRPLVALDLVLIAFARLKQGDTSAQSADLFTEFCRAILLAEEVTADIWENNPSRGLFDRDIHARAKRLAAISLVRLLSVAPFLFSGELRINAFRLFDETLAKDVYAALKIETRDMSHEKETRLLQALESLESELRAQIDAFASILTLAPFRQQFFRTINGSISKAFLWPFINREQIARLTEVFALVEDYLDRADGRGYESFRKAKEALESYSSVARSQGTEYSIDILAVLADKVLSLLQTHFDESPASRPAELLLEAIPKKHPLHSVGNRVSLGFVLKNRGQGPAFDVTVQLDEITDFQAERNEVCVNCVQPGTFRVEVSGSVLRATEYVLVTGCLLWRNFDDSPGRQDIYLALEGQRSDIDWDSLVNEDPYHLEPITTEDELVGRTEILNQLIAVVQGKSMGSSYVYGQKRVGKTSIVKTLKSRLEKQGSKDFLVVYLEGGDYVNPDARATIDTLGRRLCQEIRQADSRFSRLDIPTFCGALAPLGEFLNEVLRIVPDYRILFILDEFDELPMDLYKRGAPVGDAFFLSIRSISGKAPFGFVLVGGEKMEFILGGQGTALNKFQPIRVDYFEKETQWEDFRQLVCRPVTQWLEFEHDALEAINERAAGNPYFTRLLCRSLFKLMVTRRDCHVTRAEVDEAARQTLRTVGSNSFQHFWEDGIFYSSDQIEQVSMRRRKILVAVGETLRSSPAATRDDVINQAKADGIMAATVEYELKDFARRQVLLTDPTVRCKVPLFEGWLKDRGIKEIITSFADSDLVKARKALEEEAYVTSDEIVELTRSWGIYRGRSLTEDTVRAWLSQFGSNDYQRLMFRVLRAIVFYSADRIRAKLREAHNIVRRGSVLQLQEGKQKVGKRADILLSYLDGPAKSGAVYARLYADENGIFKDNVVEPGKLTSALRAREGLHALVFIDDFVGTGDTASENFRKLKESCGELLSDANFKVFFIGITGFQTAQTRVEETIESLGLRISMHLCDPLSESAKLFHETSQVFPEQYHRDKARDIALNYGIKLEKDAPLGYGECQAAVVFENSCPNNCLPILWAEERDWRPLFKRL